MPFAVACCYILIINDVIMRKLMIIIFYIVIFENYRIFTNKIKIIIVMLIY